MLRVIISNKSYGESIDGDFKMQQNSLMSFVLSIITPAESILYENVVSASFSTEEGMISVLPGHSKMILSLSPGFVEYKTLGEENKDIHSMLNKIFIKSGILKIEKDLVTVVTEELVSSY